MTEWRVGLAPCGVVLQRDHLKQMIRLLRLLFKLSQLPNYRHAVADLLPQVARFDPGYAAVMMGYDFHLGPQGAQLIEVNTNAGGGLLAYLAHAPLGLDAFYRNRVLHAFHREMTLASHGTMGTPGLIAILDENPQQQFLYPEMLAFRDLFRQQGINAEVVEPEQLRMDAQGVSLEGRRVDLVYNRHCDFYLESEALVGLRAAYLAGTVCVTPNPFAYGLLADKRRMILWSDPDVLAELGIAAHHIDLLQATIPKTRLLSQMDREALWQDRKHWVFKPVTSFGSRGVVLGKGVSRARFLSLEPELTLVQQMVSPSTTFCDGENTELKVDFRLFAYQNRVLGVSARLYQGQVTNFRLHGNGFAAVRVV
ncbi:MAG: hypothetical protein H7832_12660 [Magnetococcus sp. DMHC-6]